MYYSQNNQDKYLEENIFKGYKNGFFVEVGANDGLYIPNTLYFENNNNWTGINIEPIKSLYDRLLINRPKCINYNCAIYSSDGEKEFICNEGYTEGLSGIKDTYDARHFQRLNKENALTNSKTKLINVNTKKLETIFDENNIKHVNYLSIDVEGAEFAVIKSINFDKIFIDVISFENNYNDVTIPIIKYLEEKNYKLINTYGDIMMINKDSVFTPFTI